VIIGRDPSSANIVLESSSVSRSHTRVYLSEDGQIAVSDMGSTNGTFLVTVSGDRRRIAGEEFVTDRQRFTVGDGDDNVFEVRYSDLSQPARQTYQSQPGRPAAAPESGFSSRVMSAAYSGASGNSASAYGGDFWINGLKFAAKFVFALFIIAGIIMGYTASQYTRGLWSLWSFAVPAVLCFAAGFLSVAVLMVFLNMAVDLREIKNILRKK
jgi:hypothetical protein